jgi:diadenosine tetraphosphate (Ap4A) HIT family hydrolase
MSIMTNPNPQLNGPQCVFCSSEVIAKRLIVKNNLIQVFPTNIPIVPGHLLLCPVRHIHTFDQLTDEEVIELFHALTMTKQALRTSFAAEGYNYAWNEGSVAGQSVPHLHLHILPRKEGDSGITQYEPREFLYRPGSREETPETELISIAQEIRSHMVKSSS